MQVGRQPDLGGIIIAHSQSSRLYPVVQVEPQLPSLIIHIISILADCETHLQQKGVFSITHVKPPVLQSSDVVQCHPPWGRKQFSRRVTRHFQMAQLPRVPKKESQQL